MMKKDEVVVLRAEVKELKKEVAGLMEFIQAMYSMMSEEGEEYEEPPGLFGNSAFGRFNT
ncbi:hypothetical protein Mpt1_c13030 [Candidatus Methanoplasma termitum]|uniref:Uncharacterized protein n=1 Tax=Candidatus Methanoplasma termitum TaxID=1577791 RepID=A0A0A7LDD7_9ARCH|nr:hypothetical protein [Candidatus Methanoplasma termitum]AIZ57165.1 hypothetical protein Mpt1_c13030 [Candidatus Methanoplasma termitum]MCL2333610.1 hypothetical protein [Candidatus Methanoplasma sp.]